MPTATKPIGKQPVDPAKARQHDQEREQYEQAIAAIEPHLQKSADGKFQLNVHDARELGIPQPVFEHLRSALERTNDMIDKGEVKADVVRLQSDTQLPPSKFSGTCAGRDLALQYWWGTKTYVDECITQEIEGLLAVGAGVVAIAGALSVIGAIPSGVAAGFLGLEVGYIQLIDGMGANQGVIFNQPWFGPGWVWHQ
jgi:hypothetical protein